MAFFTLLIYISLIYIRPQEWMQALYGLPLVNIAAVTTAFLYLISKEKKFISVQQNTLMLWFLAALVLSHLSHLYFGGALIAFQDFLSTMIMYFLIANIVNTQKRLRIAIDVLVILTLILAIQGIVQSNTGFGWAGQPILIAENVPRITWIGIFNDPNDLALAFVIVVPFLLSALVNRNGFLRKLYSLAAMGVLSYGVYLTNSRGGMLALAAVVCAYMFLYLKRKGHLVVGVLVSLMLVAAVFAFSPSRMGNVSADDESAYGRIEAWYEGMQMLKSAPVFGVGYKMFTEHHFRTAHNSFILCAAETGFFGYLIWIGLFYFSFKNLIYIIKHSGPAEKLSEQAFSVAIGLLGYAVASYFLSRTYIPILYMLFALSAALSCMPEGNNHSVMNIITPLDFRNIFLISFSSLVFTYLLVKVSI